MDSFSFLPSSLDKLVECLRSGKKYDLSKFNYTKKFIKDKYRNITDDELKLIIQKGIVPYEYMDSFDKYNDSCLPPMECFDSTLNNEKCTENKYNHAVKIWNTFKISSLLDYWNFYLLTDITLLADVFEETRRVFMRDYELDPCRYITLPYMGNDAAYKFYGKNIKAMDDSHLEGFMGDD